MDFELPEEDELVSHALRPNRVLANSPTCSKKRVFIDLTDEDPVPLKPVKKNSQNLKREDPF